MSQVLLKDRAETVRRFNRFYTRKIGVLHEFLLNSSFSLTEVRIQYELAHSPGLTAADLCREFSLNAGYVSRLIKGFEKKGLIEKHPSPTDARVTQLFLTDLGQKTFQGLNEAACLEIMEMLKKLSDPEQIQLLEAMAQIRILLEGKAPDYILRDPHPGDMGWIVHRQSVLYTREYGWNSEYEALVAEIAARFLREFDPTRERCWIAEKNRKVVGSVFVVRMDDTTAKLRLLYVDPEARHLGIGTRLVDEAVRFSREKGYKRLTLWTNSVLTGARKIYDRAGFCLVEESLHHSFGKDLIGQILSLDLDRQS